MNMPTSLSEIRDIVSGEKVLKSVHDAALAQVGELQSKITELTALNEQLLALNQQEVGKSTQTSEVMAAEIALLKSEISESKKVIEIMNATHKTGARQAAEIIAQTGVQSIDSTVAAPVAPTKDFSALVNSAVTANKGKAKSEVIKECIAANPTEHVEWLKAGGGRL